MLKSSEIIKLLKDHRSILKEEYGVVDMAIFGSYARNEADKSSDIDIIVDLKESSTTFNNFMNLKFYLEDISGQKVDLLTKKSIRRELKQSILKEAIHV